MFEGEKNKHTSLKKKCFLDTLILQSCYLLNASLQLCLCLADSSEWMWKKERQKGERKEKERNIESEREREREKQTDIYRQSLVKQTN